MWPHRPQPARRSDIAMVRDVMPRDIAPGKVTGKPKPRQVNTRHPDGR
jgi:hypothetical protein